MDELELELSFNGRDLKLPVRLIKWGYSYRVEVSIEDTPIMFEPDEEGTYRGISENGILNIDVELLQAIAEKLEKLRG